MSKDDLEIVDELKAFLIDNFPAAKAVGTLPIAESLYALGVLDSFAIVELVSFIEKRWNIRIPDKEITAERFSIIQNMASYIEGKIQVKETK